MVETIRVYPGDELHIHAHNIGGQPPVVGASDKGFDTVSIVGRHRVTVGSEFAEVAAVRYTMVQVNGHAHNIEADDYAHGVGEFILVHYFATSSGDAWSVVALDRVQAVQIVSRIYEAMARRGECLPVPEGVLPYA